MSEKLIDSTRITSEGIVVKHRPERNRFEAAFDDGLAVLVYMKVGNTLIFHHTEVPEALEGQGIAGALAKAGLEYVKENGINASALCPFVKAYVKRHPEYETLLSLKA